MVAAHRGEQAYQRKATWQSGVHAVDETILWFCQWWLHEQVITDLVIIILDCSSYKALSVSQYYINFIATNCKRRNSLSAYSLSCSFLTYTATMLLREGKAAKGERIPTEGHRCPLTRRPSLLPQVIRLKPHMVLSGQVGRRLVHHNAVLSHHLHLPTLVDQLMMNKWALLVSLCECFS